MKAYAREYPNLIQLQSIGKSYEGRDVWLVTATNFKSGKDSEKPAFWVDGNLHASEVTGSAAALYLIHSLVTRYKQDANVTRALDTRVFYIVPRVNPDGAEWALADRPKEIRSSTRPYPYVEDHIDGMVTGEAIDGDGRILQMRIEDRAYKNAFLDETTEGTDDRAKAEWVVKAKRGSKVKMEARHDRAGVVKVDVVLK